MAVAARVWQTKIDERAKEGEGQNEGEAVSGDFFNESGLIRQARWTKKKNEGKEGEEKRTKDWMELIGKEPSKDKAVGKESAFREDKTRKEAWPQHRVR
jgi:hypothetical protein